jgi:hypothetical protein
VTGSIANTQLEFRRMFGIRKKPAKSTIQCIIVSSESPPTWRARSSYLYPPGTGWSSPKSKSKVTLKPTASLSICLVSSPLGYRRAVHVFERILIRHLEGYIRAKLLMYVIIRRAACEACSATWTLGTNSAFALGPRKATENLDRAGRSQDLPDAK